MGTKLVAGAVGVASTAAGVARHLLWYVSYRMEGTARADDTDEPRRTPRS